MKCSSNYVPTTCCPPTHFRIPKDQNKFQRCPPAVRPKSHNNKKHRGTHFPAYRRIWCKETQENQSHTPGAIAGSKAAPAKYPPARQKQACAKHTQGNRAHAAEPRGNTAKDETPRPMATGDPGQPTRKNNRSEWKQTRSTHHHSAHTSNESQY